MTNGSNDNYDPPRQQYIRNALTFGLLSGDSADSGLQNAQSLGYVSSDLEYVMRKRGGIIGKMVKFAYTNKTKIKNLPVVGKLALSVKRRMVENNLRGASPYLPYLDLSEIMGLDITGFIQQLYLRALGRNADPEGMELYKKILCSGGTREAVAYMLITSKEFSDRARVANLEQYQKAYWRYRIPHILKRLPVIGWLWAVVTMPERIYRIEVEERMRFVDHLTEERQQFNRIDEFNRSLIYVSKKLDEISAAEDRNKPVIYGLPGGVTAVQTQDYVIGVPSEDWRLAYFLRLYGWMELGTEKYFRSLLKKGMNVVDVGANLGIYTLHALKAGCQVYSYEPTPKIYKILVDNIGINGFEPTGRAKPYNLAVVDQEGVANFALYENTSGQNNNLFEPSADRIISVRTVCLDQHLSSLSHIDIVKIDVEGAEPLVLKGMTEIIEKNPDIRIVMEFAPTHIKRAGNAPLDFIHAIHEMGLEIHLIDDQSGEVSEIRDEDLCNTYSANVLLTRRV